LPAGCANLRQQKLLSWGFLSVYTDFQMYEEY